MSAEPHTPRPSATIVLLREGEGRHVEVLLLQRADRGDQNSLRWVFPGGLIDASDHLLRPHFHDLDDATASERLGLAQGGLDYWASVLREAFEEAGVLLAVDGRGDPVGGAQHDDSLRTWRERALTLPRGQGGAAFARLCEERRWRMPGGSVVPLARWITPVGMPKRFDTMFFVAASPAGHDVRIDGVEIVDHRWVRVTDLAQQRAAVSVRGPSLFVAQDLARFSCVDAVLAWVRGLGRLDTVRPRLAVDDKGQLSPVHPSHPAYAEIGRIDPHGRGLAHSRIRPGVPAMLVEGKVIRITAGNGGMMTGPGTNTYLLRAAGGDWVLVDPGPDDASHVNAILEVLRQHGARLVAILVTHTHLDHSPAARALKAATGAACMGRLANHRERQDPHFAPDVTLSDGDRLDFGGGCVLRVIHTPGHASNQLCFLHMEQRLLFTGDHVMQGSTVVINPPDGDMAAYLASLQRLACDGGHSFDAIAPGHGFLMDEPTREFEGLIAHRRRREAKLRQVLADGDAASIDELVVRVYDDVPAERHEIARRSLTAHLLYLRQQGHADESDGRWSLRP